MLTDARGLVVWLRGRVSPLPLSSPGRAEGANPIPISEASLGAYGQMQKSRSFEARLRRAPQDDESATVERTPSPVTLRCERKARASKGL
jgi:hypothetical protein